MWWIWAEKSYQQTAQAKPGVLRLKVLDMDEVISSAEDRQDDAQQPDGAQLDVPARDQGLPKSTVQHFKAMAKWRAFRV